MLLYEINTRAWLRDLSDKTGSPIRLAQVPQEEIGRWVRFGFTDIWLMGVWRISPGARDNALHHWRSSWKNDIPSEEADVLGSPFAIEDYFVDPALGGAEELIAFRQRINSAGLGLILDFIPNHFAFDCAAAASRPTYFVQAPTGAAGAFERKTKFGKKWFAHGRDPHFPPWDDTIQFDHRNGAAQQALLHAASQAAAFCDGFRCDMAMLILPEIFEKTWAAFPAAAREPTRHPFWPELKHRVSIRHPYFFLIGEVYWDLQARLLSEGFDLAYNKKVYDFLMRRDYSDLREHLIHGAPDVLSRGVHFLENHDEPRVAATLPLRRHKAAAVLLMALPGMSLLHDGQLEGRKAFARIQMSKRLPEAPDPDITAFYEKLLIAVKDTALRDGEPQVLAPAPDGAGEEWREIIAIAWRAEPGKLDLAIINLGERPARCALPLQSAAPEAPALLFTSENIPPAIHSRDARLIAELPPETAQIVRIQVPRE